MRFGLSLHPYSVAMIACALVSFLLGARAWFGAKKALSRSFALIQAAICVWSLFRLIQWEVVSPEAQLEAIYLQFAGMFFVPSGFYLFARALSKRSAKGIHVFLVLLPSFAFLALLATNAYSHFFLAAGELAALPLYPKGAWGFWAFIAYSYIQVGISLIIIVKVAIRSRGIFARWMRHFLTLFILPFCTNVIYVLCFIERTAYDPTPIVFAVSAFFIALTLNNFDFFEAVPYAKSLVLDSIGTPLIVVDEEGIVVGANEEAKRFSSGTGILEGRLAREVIPAIAEVGVDGDGREWSFRDIDYQISCHLVRPYRTRWGGKIFMFRDITALVKARREVEEARARADAANAAKSAFVAFVSHELRNPLNAIIGLADLNLRAQPEARLSPAIAEDLEVMLSSGNIMLGLVNDLLDLSKIEAGKMELESVDFDLHEKAVSMLKAFRPAVEKKGIFLDTVVEAGTPRYVRGDPLRYGQVLMNLVSNAVKFTERGAVAVTLSPAPPPAAVPGDSRELCALTTVRDTGIGIAADKMPRLFREFSQADPSVGRRFGGTGLGLSISQKLVGLLGGEIDVKSEEGKGSVFSFTARFEPGEQRMAQREPGPSLGPSERSLRVLVVDDDPINVAVARRYLERLGHEVARAGTGGAALEQLGRGAFDLVLLDLGLPDMDGFEAYRRIRAETERGRAEGFPVAAMTARAESGLRGACASAGMIDCLPKPLDPAALLRLLRRVAEAPHELGPHAAASVQASRLPSAADRAAPRPAAPGTPLVDEAALSARLEGDSAFMRELLRIFSDEAPGRRDAYAAALQARNLDALQKLGHALKGSSLSLCAIPLGAAAGAVEAACIAAKRSGFAVDAVIGPIAKDTEGLLELLGETVAAAEAILEG